ncbi:MAG: hypothetical protein LBD73_02340, partial [Deferribacteraceae bacterium]|nr:hypothetical protein [Deferribacteraceae bacterium]
MTCGFIKTVKEKGEGGNKDYNSPPNRRVSDDTIFASGRAKIIPFNRHFTEAEQDRTLKQEFRKAKNKRAILNWLIMGYRLIPEVGFDAPPIVTQAIAEYRQDADIIGVFLSERTEPM